VPMEGGTTSYFVTGRVLDAQERVLDAAK
jgi:hypothetical protein